MVGLAAFQGFAQGVQTGATLQNMMRTKKMWEREDEDFERQRQTRRSIEQGYAQAGVRGAANAALAAGNPQLAQVYDSVANKRMAMDTAKADKDQMDFGRTLMAIAPTPESMIENIDAVNRFVQTNPDLWRKISMMGPDRTPVGIQASETPGGFMLAMDVYNSKTGSIGPATERATADADDTVMAVKPDVIWNIANSWAGGEQPGRGTPGNEEVVPKYKISGDWIYEENTGSRERLPTNPYDRELNLQEKIAETADSIAHSQGALQFDTNARSRLMSTVAEVGTLAHNAGINPFEAMYQAAGYLTSQGEIRAMAMEGQTEDDREAGLMMLYQRMGLFETVSPGIQAPVQNQPRDLEEDLTTLPSERIEQNPMESVPSEMPTDPSATGRLGGARGRREQRAQNRGLAGYR